MTQHLERGAKKIVQKLVEHGYEAYLVGGCVRDMQLKRSVKDYDIATSAKPEQVQRIFHRTIPTGLQHGTVSVKMEECIYEVTTFRKESGYEDYRRPSGVEYIDSLYEDLRRRDFTMNAMALDLEGHLIDPFHGVSDIEHGVLRCVGDANERFQEDALRMLRCIRFAAEYGLEIEQQTWLALREQAPLLSHIAMERVRMELDRMISGSSPDRAVDLMMDSKLLSSVKYPLKLAGLKREKLSGEWSKLNDPVIKWAYLYLCSEVTAAETEHELRQLTFSKQQLEKVRSVIAAAHALCRQAGVMEPQSEYGLEQAWKLTAVEYGKPAVEAIHQILTIDSEALAERGLTGQQCLIQNGLAWLNGMPVHSIEELQAGGKELLSRIGKPAGPWVSQVLVHLLKEAALNRLDNEKEALLVEAERYYASLTRQESGTYEHK
ncbi:MAG: polynucleotide adenylyltransferase region [Paenibacillus sp.]|jgi:tRNA nucleotidyltransferase (CCA-adding enzyme)|nr:polynucleotide adenylyltransferase region [Paenibacillus sp.]